MTEATRRPALLLDWLTPVYDLFARLFMPEKRFKKDLIANACIAPGHRVFDSGAGTSTLAFEDQERYEGLQRFLETVHKLSSKGRPSRFDYLNRKRS